MAFCLQLRINMQQNISYKANELGEKGYYFNKVYYFQKAWKLISPYWLILSAFTALYVSFLYFALRNPDFGQIAQMIIAGPISAGYYLTINKIRKGEYISFGNFFDGFKMFMPVMIVSMLSGLIISIGMLLLVIPGIFFSVIYLFAMPLVVFDKLDFWAAMESSRIIITKNFTEAFLFGLMIVGVNILGLLAFGLGVLITIPLSYAVILMAYEDIYNFEEIDEGPIKGDFSHFR